MKTVFIAGSIKIKQLDPAFLMRLDNIVSDDLRVIVGDADGVDHSVQAALLARDARDVTVYHSGDRPRNNLGGWVTKSIRTSAAPGSREFYTAKDRAMAAEADLGMMLWDSASAGTLENIFELTRSGKKTVVFVNKIKRFVIVRNDDDIVKLVDLMSDAARVRLDKKIGLSKKIFEIQNHQLGLMI